MPKKNLKKSDLTRKMIFDAAKKIASLGKNPTIKSIREMLGGRGSETTLHKYLTQWKQECLKRASEGSGLEEEIKNPDFNRVLQEREKLKEALSQQIHKNEVLASELLIAERELARVREMRDQQQKEIDGFQGAFQLLKKEHEQVKVAYDQLCQERETTLSSILADKNQWIQQLQEELKETHRENVAKIRDLSFKEQDLLIQEKVKTINYEEKIKLMTETIEQLKAENEKAYRMADALRQEKMKHRCQLEDQPITKMNEEDRH